MRIITLIRFMLFCAMFFCATIASATKLHVVVVGDTGDASIGQSVATDIKAYREIASKIERALAESGITTDFTVLSGSKCSYNSLDSFLDNFSCKGDIVFFIYNGHGGRSHQDESQFPRMCLGESYAEKWMKISDLVARLKAKNPRMQVVLTDCCNSYYDRVRNNEESALSGIVADFSEEGLRQLFLNNTGDVCITAASPGEYGWCTNLGGSLTLGFRQALSDETKEKGSAATWEDVMSRTTKLVYDDSYKKYSNGWISNTQRPVYEVHVNGVGTPSPDDNVDSDEVVDSDNTQPDSDEDFDDEIYEDYDEGEGIITNFGDTLINFMITLIIGLFFVYLPKITNNDGTIFSIIRIGGFLIILYAVVKFLSNI